MHILGHLSIEEFLKDYWQKKPILIRKALPDFAPLISAQELAGLSLEEEIESRLIIENTNTEEDSAPPWEVRKGPFTENDYQNLPESHWTLLVQAVDHWLPEAADLLEYFRFIPSWRIDDLMISYATDAGSVGAHYDQYDVFLLQAEGQREWRIGQMCDEQTPLIDNCSVKILQEFEETERWVLNPGDMLYLPPQLAHWGISQGECQTYSIGFRAPSTAQLLERVVDEILPTLTQDQRYSDRNLSLTESSAEITPQAIDRLQNLLMKQIQNKEVLAAALGKLMTEPKYPDYSPENQPLEQELTWEDLLAEFNESGVDAILTKDEHARLAYSFENEKIRFFYQGESSLLTHDGLKLIRLLTEKRTFSIKELFDVTNTPQEKSLFIKLWELGVFY